MKACDLGNQWANINDIQGTYMDTTQGIKARKLVARDTDLQRSGTDHGVKVWTLGPLQLLSTHVIK